MSPGSFQQHPRLWLPASAQWLKVMWTVINSVNSRASSFKFTTQLCVHRIEFGSCDESPRDATLVAYHSHEVPSLVQRMNSFTSSGKKLHVLPARHILTFGSFTVDHSVAIEKGSLLHGISPAPPIPKWCAR